MNLDVTMEMEIMTMTNGWVISYRLKNGKAYMIANLIRFCSGSGTGSWRRLCT